MRKYFILLLVLLVTLSMCSCKAQLDKAKIAGLLAGFVLDYASNNELPFEALNDLAIELAPVFVDEFIDEIPDRYRTEVRDFAVIMIVTLIEDYGLGGLGSSDDNAALLDDMTSSVLTDFELFHEYY